MDALASLQQYTSVHPSVVKFKPWTELFMELALAGLFTVGFVAWSQILVEAGGLLCVPSHGDTYGFNLSEARYVSSRCQMTFLPRMLLFYPYYVMLSVGVLIIAHILWTKLPAVVAKLATYCSLFNQISHLTPKFSKEVSSKQVLPRFDHPHHNKEKVKTMYERVLFMFLEKSYVKQIYIRKCRGVAALCVFFIVLTVMWVWLSNFGNTTYSCEIDFERNPHKKAGPFSCDASPAIYIFGVMIFHLFTLSVVFVLSIYASISHTSDKNSIDVFSSNENYDRFKELPGVQDFVFCVSLMRSNFPDGLFTFHAVKYVLTQYQELGEKSHTKAPQEVKIFLYEDDPEVAKKKEDIRNRLHKFDEAVIVVRYMLYELGLKEVPNGQNKSHIYDCLEYIVKRSNAFSVDVCYGSIRELIVEELITHRAYYKLFLDILEIDHPQWALKLSIRDSNKFPFVKLEEMIKRIRDPEVWGEWISLAAIVNICGVKIVLIHPGKTHGERSNFIMDEYLPHSNPNCTGVYIMTYLEPYYYHVTEPTFEQTPFHYDNRKLFVSSYPQRNKLRKMAISMVTTFRKVGVDDIVVPEHINQPSKTQLSSRFTVLKASESESVSHFNTQSRVDSKIPNYLSFFPSESAAPGTSITINRFHVMRYHEENSSPDVASPVDHRPYGRKTLARIKQQLKTTIGSTGHDTYLHQDYDDGGMISERNPPLSSDSTSDDG